MAARTTKKSGAALERLRADLKAGSPANMYIFYGEETYLRDRYLEELRQLLVPAGFEEFNYHRLPGKGLTVQDLTETVEAMPMMAQHTLVVACKHAVKGGFFQQSKAYPVCAAKIGYFGAKAAVFIFAQKDMLKLPGAVFQKFQHSFWARQKKVVIFLFFSVQVYILK